MSGAALNPWAVQTEPEETARRLARALGCASDDDDAMVQFLRGVDHVDLVRVARSDAVPEQDKPRLLKFSFVTTPEREVAGVETFLPAPVEQLMKEGRHHDVPYMTGVTSVEALMLFPSIGSLENEEGVPKIDTNWETNLLPELRLPAGGQKSKLALKALREFFMNGKPLSEETHQGYLDMISDITFGEGIEYALRSIVKSNKAPVYQYIFSADDKLNTMKIMLKIDKPGSTHADDLGYLFCQQGMSVDLPDDSTAARTRRRFVRLWTNFSKTGNPSPRKDPLLEVVWKPYTEKQRNYLEIGNQLKTGTDLRAERVAFWEKFYATYAS